MNELKEHSNSQPSVDKEKLEEEIWKQAEESLRQELADQIKKDSEMKLKQVTKCKEKIVFKKHL